MLEMVSKGAFLLIAALSSVVTGVVFTIEFIKGLEQHLFNKNSQHWCSIIGFYRSQLSAGFPGRRLPRPNSPGL